MQPDRTAELKDRLEQHILVLDGAMGTMIQRRGLQERRLPRQPLRQPTRMTSRATTTYCC
jgi:methionine synthase I (cobalamin-dependent)